MESFKAKVRESGPAAVITIPNQYIKDGHIETGKTYRFMYEEVPDVADA